MAYKTSNKGFIGDFLSSVAQPALSLAGSAFGPIGTIVGSGLGSAISPLAKRIPFQAGGIVMKAKKKKAKQPAKGSKAMKLKMARLRMLRGK